MHIKVQKYYSINWQKPALSWKMILDLSRVKMSLTVCEDKKTSNQPKHPPSLIRVFPFSIHSLWILGNKKWQVKIDYSCRKRVGCFWVHLLTDQTCTICARNVDIVSTYIHSAFIQCWFSHNWINVESILFHNIQCWIQVDSKWIPILVPGEKRLKILFPATPSFYFSLKKWQWITYNKSGKCLVWKAWARS